MRISSVNLKMIYYGMAKKQLNASDLSRKIGITQQAVSLILNGKRQGSLKTLGAICNVLDLPIMEVITLEDD